ncbi:MAG TPA: hypothetical protein VFM55_07545 [Micromonosporaceae bacterium]|nr:hypothetical protein [Micromonosporaceae bacterium]
MNGLAAASRRPLTWDVAVCLGFVALAGWLAAGLLVDPTGRALALNPEDQILVEWFLAYDSRLLLGDFALVTDRLNAPEGVNLLNNATTITLGALLGPVTIAFGAPVTFAVALAGNLAATAAGWYLLLSRGLGLHRAAAAVGAAVCGFAPAMVSQSNSHLHMTAQWLVPAIIWYVVRMARAADPDGPYGDRAPARLLSSALALAALVVVQVFLGEEVLFLTALTLVLIVLGYALVQPARTVRLAGRFLAGMALATAVATAVLAYPLWLQFAGPQHVPNGPFNNAYFSTDLASFPAFSPLSVAGQDRLPLPGSGVPTRLTTGASEYNTFFGWPLLAVLAGCVVWLRRHPLTWPFVAAGTVMAWLSLGPQIVINGERTPQRGLYTLIEEVRVIDAALPMRFVLPLVPLIGILLALALDRALSERRLGYRDPADPAPGRRPAARLAWLAVPVVVVAALLPLAPRQLPTTERAPVPAFIAEGHWRGCVEPGGVLVPVPLPTPYKPETMRWATAANAAFGIPEGFFIAPYGRNGRASVGTYAQPTSRILAKVAQTGQAPAVDDGHRAQARADLAFWNASCVVLGEHPNAVALRATLEALLGPGEYIAEAWVWRIRPA